MGKYYRKYRKSYSKDKKQDKRIRKIERRVNAIEVKNNEGIIQALTPMAITATWWHLSSVAQGDTVYTRSGNKINPIEAQVRWTFQNVDTVNLLACRGMLVRLRASPTSTVPADSDMFIFGSASPWGTLDYGQAVSYSRKGFRQPSAVDILYDTGTIQLSPVDTTASAEFATDKFYRQINLRKKLNFSKQVAYNGTGANDDIANSIFWVTFAETTSVSEQGTLSIIFVDP